MKPRLIPPALMIAVLHFILTFLLAFATGVGTLKSFWVGVLNVITFPLSLINPPDNPEWLGWVAWILLSLIWGFTLAYLINKLTSRKS